MNEEMVTKRLLDRIKYFINAVENGNSEAEIKDYDFTINLHRSNGKHITIQDNYCWDN